MRGETETGDGAAAGCADVRQMEAGALSLKQTVHPQAQALPALACPYTPRPGRRLKLDGNSVDAQTGCLNPHIGMTERRGRVEDGSRGIGLVNLGGPAAHRLGADDRSVSGPQQRVKVHLPANLIAIVAVVDGVVAHAIRRQDDAVVTGPADPLAAAKDWVRRILL